MTPILVQQAARNNALWCETVCRAHDAPGKFHDALWLNHHCVPRFYPNVVTLSAHADAVARQLGHIQDLVAAGLAGGWSVKDSFGSLDLAPLGFQVLFAATWLWRAPSPPVPSRRLDLRWAWVRSASDLAKWEVAWSGCLANDDALGQPRVFVPALLTDNHVGFLGAYRNHKVVAGAIAHHTDDVVGLSNVFISADDPPAFWAGFLAMFQERFPGVPIVGYEHGPGLAIAKEIGFAELHPLKVWARSA